jgi:hypothetical protein
MHATRDALAFERGAEFDDATLISDFKWPMRAR